MTSVVSRNLFDLLGESEDAEAVKEKEPSAKETVVPQKKVDRSRAQPKEARIRFEYPQRGGHKAPTSNRSEDTRSAPRDRNVGPRLSGRREEGNSGGDYPIRSSRGARPGDRGRGGGRGRRGREYDRHSGTGKYDSEKKENQAWGNATATDTWENNESTEASGWNAESNTNDDSWGADNTTGDKNNWNAGVTEEKSNDAWNTTEDTNTSSNWDQPSGGGGDEGKTDTENQWEMKKEDTADSAPVPEPEEAVKTYDEYLAEKAQKSLDISLPEFRKPNEGADDSQWKDAVPLEKDEEEEFLFAGKEQHFRSKSKKSKTKNYLEIAQTFERPGGGSSRGRGRGRGGRGGGRGGRDDRDGRDGRNSYDDNNRDNRRRGGGGRGVNLDDQRAFPSLGAS